MRAHISTINVPVFVETPGSSHRYLVSIAPEGFSIEDVSEREGQLLRYIPYDRLHELVEMDRLSEESNHTVDVVLSPRRPMVFQDIKRVEDAWDFFTELAPRGTRITGQLMRKISEAIYGRPTVLLGWQRVDGRDEWRRDRPDDDMGLLGGA